METSLPSLKSIGVCPEDVTDVVFTHLHFDHIGWATADDGPFFPTLRSMRPPLTWTLFCPATRATSFSAAVFQCQNRPRTSRSGHRSHPRLGRLMAKSCRALMCG